MPSAFNWADDVIEEADQLAHQKRDDQHTADRDEKEQIDSLGSSDYMVFANSRFDEASYGSQQPISHDSTCMSISGGGSWETHGLITNDRYGSDHVGHARSQTLSDANDPSSNSEEDNGSSMTAPMAQVEREFNEMKTALHETYRKYLDPGMNYRLLLRPPSTYDVREMCSILRRKSEQTGTINQATACRKRAIKLATSLKDMFSRANRAKRLEATKSMRAFGICDMTHEFTSAERTILKKELANRSLSRFRCIPSQLRESWTYLESC